VIPGKQYTPEVLAAIAWRRKWCIAVPALVIAVAVAAWTHYLPDQYRSETLILVVPQRVPESYVRSTVTTRIEDRLQAISQQIMSRTKLEQIIQDFNLYTGERKTLIMEDIVDQMRKYIDVQVVKGDAFRVSFISDEPRTAMRVTERLASFFIDESLRDRALLADGTNQFLEAQLEQARRALIDTEQKLEAYRRRHAGELPTERDSNIQGVHNTEMQLQALIESLNRDRDRHLVVERAISDAQMAATLAETAAAAAPAPPSAEPAEAPAANQLRAAQAALQALALRLKPEHPDIGRLKRQITELQRRADAEAAARPVSADPVPPSPADAVRRSRLDDLRTELGNLDRQIAFKTGEEARVRKVLADYQKRLEATPTRESELTDLTRDYATLQTAYQSLLTKKQDSQISTNLERRQIGEQFRILDPARLPERPFSPNRPLIYGMGVLAGLAVGFGLVALMEYLDRTMRSEADVRTALNLPVLATIPLIRESAPRRKRVATESASAAAALLATLAAIVGRIVR
jgi:polysaccharide chain length determinant protein (PEP-CTERM system associated)